MDEFITDSKEARCPGLLKRVALRQRDLKKVHADYTCKSDGPFMCPVCMSEAIIRKCTDKVDHFAHNARLSSVLTGKDSVLHNLCRDEICEYFKRHFPEGKWESERTIPKNEAKGYVELRPDISGYVKEKGAVAVEIQKSAYTVKRIFQKSIEYTKRNIYVVWIVPLKKPLGMDPFRPRLYEKFLHSFHLGRVYYYVAGDHGKILPVHYSPTKRWIPESSWFDKELGEERSEGGFFLKYKTVKSPLYGQVVDLATDFSTVEKKLFEHKNEKMNVPDRKVYQDRLQSWWSKDERKNLENLKEVVNNGSVFEEYDPEDKYDEFEE